MSHPPIEDINDLREHAIMVLQKLNNKEITIEEAGASSKLCENIISTVKYELEYAKLSKRVPKIKFIGDCVGGPMESSPTLKNPAPPPLPVHKKLLYTLDPETGELIPPVEEC